MKIGRELKLLCIFVVPIFNFFDNLTICIKYLLNIVFVLHCIWFTTVYSDVV